MLTLAHIEQDILAQPKAQIEASHAWLGSLQGREEFKRRAGDHPIIHEFDLATHALFLIALGNRRDVCRWPGKPAACTTFHIRRSRTSSSM